MTYDPWVVVCLECGRPIDERCDIVYQGVHGFEKSAARAG